MHFATARIPGHIFAPSTLALWTYGQCKPVFVRHGFSFLRQSQHSQHWQLPGHPDRIKSLMDSAEVQLVSICQMIEEPGEVLYNAPKSQVS